jgi:4a-hydroxytetrahydrobiopterin dehydratase
MARAALSTEEIRDKLRALPGWELREGYLCRSFEFRDFVEAFGFMSQVALWAEKLNHHPDWRNVYRRIDVALSTHDVGGISDLDFTLARKISDLAASLIR